MNVARGRAAALVFGLVVAGCTSPAPTPSGMTPPPPVESLLPAPRDCPLSTPPDEMILQNFGGGFSDGVVVLGRAPVWTLGLPGDSVLHLPPVSANDSRFPNAKIMWIVGPKETQPVIARGQERSTGGPLWFQEYPSNGAPGLPSSYTTTLVLDPATPNRGFAEKSSGDWSIWGIGVGAPAAGCYRMTVSSSKGTWTIQLAIGS